MVAGDAKTYLWLRELKQQCGSELNWHVEQLPEGLDESVL